MNDLTDLLPKTDDDYAAVLAFLRSNETQWQDQLNSGLAGLVGHLDAAGYLPLLAAKNPELVAGHGSLAPDWAVLVSARVKKPEAIIAKMRRFGEPLRVMLDRWGYRVVVTNETTLGAVADTCAELWETPTPDELLLRNGELQFGSSQSGV